MTRVKKIILGLSIVFVMAIAFVIGCVGNSSNKPVVAENVEPKQLTTYNFEENEVKVKRGSSNLKYSYIPNPDSKAGSSVAYEYTFNNPMSVQMGVNLKSIDTTGVTVSYAYSDTKLSNITSGTSPFEFQKLNQHVTRYIYIIVTPTSDEIPSTFQANVVWYQGKAGTVTTYDASGNTISTQEIVKGQPMEKPETPTVEEGYEFGGWYLDEECTIPADFNSMQGVTLYPKIEEGYPEANLPSDWLAWDSSTSSYYVTGGTSTLPTDLVIPETHNDGTHGEANVTSINVGYMDFESGTFGSLFPSNLQSVTLPSTITTIGDAAFCYLSNITSVNLDYCSESLTTIGSSAFDGLELINVDLSKCINLITIADGAFAGCYNLTAQDLSKCINLTTIGNAAFNDCSGLTSITLPSSLTNIQENAFMECSGLTSIDLSQCTSLTSIETWAFAYCSGLTSITIPASVTKIGYEAFVSTGLTSMTFEDTSTWYYGTLAQQNNMSGGTSISVTNASTNATYFTATYRTYYWYKTNEQTTGELPSDWINGDTIVKGTSALPNVLTIPYITDSTIIEAEAFAGCTELEKIIIEGCVDTIGEGAFRGCTNLKIIEYPALSLTLSMIGVTINSQAFEGCTSFTAFDYCEDYLDGAVILSNSVGEWSSTDTTPEQWAELILTYPDETWTILSSLEGEFPLE